VFVGSLDLDVLLGDVRSLKLKLKLKLKQKRSVVGRSRLRCCPRALR
jgi:uncharacterized protein YlxP (DUF503 family)